jgi:PKD repeat protein
LSGNFWLFGGTAYNPSAYNDLWKFDPALNEWAWMSGPNFQGDPGNYGVKCVASPTNLPSNRYENRSCWTDHCGNFYFFGGTGYPGGEYNDLWHYNVSADMWTWVSGDTVLNSPGLFGTQGVSSPLNVPPSRMGSSSWMDSNGNLWLFGGFVGKNDLWRFVPDPSCTQCSSTPVAAFNAPNHICPGTCTDFNNLSTFATSFTWIFPGGSPSLSTDVNPTNICYNTPGVYPVTLIATNAADTDTLVLNNYMTVYPYPAAQGILQNGDTLFANAGAVSYQWYHDGNILPGATEYFYVASEGGSYNVVATDINGCEVEAVIFDVVAGISQLAVGNWQLAIIPNPVSEMFTVIGYPLNETSIGALSIYNMLGEKMFSAVDWELRTVNCQLFPSGMYWLHIESNGHIQRIKFIKN